MDKTEVKVSRFHCNEHGKVRPIVRPYCPKCMPEMTLAEAVEKENKRCQTVIERVFNELGEQGVSLQQLEQAIFFALNPEFPIAPTN